MNNRLEISGKTVTLMALGLELLLVLAAIVWSVLRDFQLPLDFSRTALWEGLKATGPLLAFNFGVFTILARRENYNIYKEFLDEVVVPICANLDAGRALLVAIAAGCGEELFFRGVLNCELGRLLTPLGGICLASFLFAYVHFIGRARHYWQLVLFYFLFGLYFSYLAYHYQDLVRPLIAHALYNFAAILYVRYYECPRRHDERNQQHAQTSV